MARLFFDPAKLEENAVGPPPPKALVERLRASIELALLWCGRDPGGQLSALVGDHARDGLDGFADDLKALRTHFNQLIARLDLRVKALVDASPERKQNYTGLGTITGSGPVVGTALVNTIERVPLKSADAFVAFTGLTHDRMTRDSIAANGASPNADQPNCAGCSTWLRCQQ